ncbi:MAG: hypothetical protein IH588_19595 [Anaerolineales bacterium]|nr:hypothetical protein [Anaerolineales bacterium]
MSCPSPRVSRVVFKYDLAGGVITNVLHVRSQAEPDAAELATITQTGIDWWENTMKTLYSAQLSLVAVEATALNIDPQLQVIDVSGLPITGTVAFDSMSANVSVVASLRTNFIGRSYRGRIYLPPPVESGVALNEISAGTQTAYKAAIEQLIADWATDNVALGILSCVQEGVAIDPGIFTQVTSVVVNTRVDTQRRRLNYL